MNENFAQYTLSEYYLATGVMERAMELGLYEQISHVDMDISAVMFHTPLDLAKLLDFDENNFEHDIVGIRQNLDRTTGLLKNHFLPRCAK